APPMLIIYKLYHIQDRLFPPATLGPWVDWTRVTRWLSHCDTHHTAHCQLSPKSERLFGDFPRRLVDVERMCVVPFRSRQRYAALSYVWGVAPTLRALRHNIHGLQQDGVLDFTPWMPYTLGDPVGQQTPLTIRHAMELTRHLGERFLWVDALCIIQDDDADRQHQLDRMGSIYANAYVTIVAAGGTALSGLRGIFGTTPTMERKADIPQHLTHYGMEKSLHGELIREHQRVKDSVWSQRGWTFQEQIFSRRLLILDNKSVTWECHCAVWLEGMEAVEKECQDRGAVAAEGFAFSAEPNFGEYARHVTPYSRRQLTYPEDALDAFAGILSVLRETAFKEGFICGLPVRFFEAALLWYNKGQLKKRQAKRQGGAPVVLPPSWAWAAWGGVVDYDNVDLGVEAGYREEGDKKLIRWRYDRPLVRWKYRASSDKDWTTVTSSFGCCLPSSDSADPTSTTSSENDANDTKGLPEEGTSTARGVTATPNHSHLLLAYPLRAFFEVQQAFGQVTAILSNGSGGSAGSITSGGQPVSKGQVCELVAVSISSMNGEEAYDVLWIEWEGGIAYRKGVGRIRKAAWEAKNPERVKLILG
ncbi:HET-domain-containing protein, partial [Staphylotrichum tortipilum]